MLERLEAIVSRYEEINNQLSSPEIVNDIKKMTELAKERNSLNETVEVFDRYKKVLNNIFTPYEKGIKGVFGLGLSIVKKTLHFLDYDITIENVKNGVKFTIY